MLQSRIATHNCYRQTCRPFDPHHFNKKKQITNTVLVTRTSTCTRTPRPLTHSQKTQGCDGNYDRNALKDATHTCSLVRPVGQTTRFSAPALGRLGNGGLRQNDCGCSEGGHDSVGWRRHEYGGVNQFPCNDLWSV